MQPFIEARYRTGPRRVLAGESLAGLFVVDTFLGSPDAFDDYIAVSPSLWWDGGNLAASSRAQLDLHAPSERRLFLALADEGDMMKFGMDMLRAALADIPESFVDYAFHDFSATETHATILHPAMLKAFRTLFEMPQPDYETPWWMDEFGEPPGYEGAALEDAHGETSPHRRAQPAACLQIFFRNGFVSKDFGFALSMRADDDGFLNHFQTPALAIRAVCRTAFSPSDPAQTICA